MDKKLKNYNVLVKALENFSLVNLDINVFNKKGENVFKKTKESAANGWPVPYLSFIEENGEPFTIKTRNGDKNWNGALHYSIDAENWNEWDGTEVSSSSDGKLYLRGKNNTKITGGSGNNFILTPNKRIKCQGNIENLLDYEVVEQGNHPKMTTSCYYRMFQGCTSLTSAPDLPATTLAMGCYQNMFFGCTNLTSAPDLPATTLISSCYRAMFQGCTSLTSAPDLPATTLADDCYFLMFADCKSLTGTIHCPASTASSSNRLKISSTATATVVYDL